MGDMDYRKAWASLSLTHEMMCDREFRPYLCKGCEYYYTNHNEIPYCLKENIREWTLYRVENNHL